MKEAITDLLIWLAYMILVFCLYKVILYFNDLFRSTEYKQRKNLDTRLYHERYGGNDDEEEYLVVIGQLKMCGYSDDLIEDLVGTQVELKYDGVMLTENLRRYVVEKGEDAFISNEYSRRYALRNVDAEKWLNVRSRKKRV